MTSIHLFLIGALLSILLSWMLVFLLRRSLAEVLEDLWKSPTRAGFWAAVACVLILLLGTFGGTSNAAYSREGQFQIEVGFFALVAQLRWTLFGLFCSLIMVAMAVMRFIGHAENSRRGPGSGLRSRKELDASIR